MLNRLAVALLKEKLNVTEHFSKWKNDFGIQTHTES